MGKYEMAPPFSSYVRDYVHQKSAENNGEMLLGISSSSANIMTNAIIYIIDRIVDIVNESMSDATSKKTLTRRHIEQATKVLFRNYSSKMLTYASERYDAFVASKDARVEGDKTVMVHHRAGIILNVARVRKIIARRLNVPRINSDASIILSAICSLFTTQILDEAMAVAITGDKKRVSEEHLLTVIRNYRYNFIFKNVYTGADNVGCEVIPESAEPAALLDIPSIDVVPDTAFRRMANMAGSIRTSQNAINYSMHKFVMMLNEILPVAIEIMRSHKRQTLFALDVVSALRINGHGSIIDINADKIANKCPQRKAIAKKRSEVGELVAESAVPEEEEKPKKIRKNKPGVKAIRDVKFYQKHIGDLCIAHASFRNLVKNIVLEMGEEYVGIRFTDKALDLLQYVCEANIIRFFISALYVARNDNRSTVKATDLLLVDKIATLFSVKL